jgi:hypothetical protein
MTRICEYCETENQIGRSHCKSCGAVLRKETSLDKQENPRAVYEKLFAICEKYEANDWCNTIETVSPKKLRQAMKAFGIPKEEQVIMLYDDTLFGSNKLGFAVCETGLYWKNAWDTPTKRTKLTWKQYIEREITLEEHSIELGRGDKISVANREKEDGEKIAELLREIRAALASGNEELEG